MFSWLLSHFTYVFSIELQFPGIMCNPWYCSPQKNFHQAAAAHASALQLSNNAKRMWETIVIFWLLSHFNHLFLIKLLCLSRMLDLWYLSSHTYFFPVAVTARLSWLKQSFNAKRMVRIHCILTTLQFLYSSFLQLHCYSWCKHVICDIAAHRRIFALLHCSLLALIKPEWRHKENGKKPLDLDVFVVHSLTVFQVNCYFWCEHMICDIEAHRLIFAPPPPSPACID